MRAGSSKHRSLAEDILKLGHAKISARFFTFYELATSTDNFNPDSLLGEGGFGRVYKGYVDSIDKVISLTLSVSPRHIQRLCVEVYCSN